MKALAPLLISLLLTGWTIQHFGSTGDLARVETRFAITADDFNCDAAQRCKHGAPRHWSAMVLRR